MTRPTLLLHIGQTKTATTALQTWCVNHRAELAAQGLLYPPTPPGHPVKNQHRYLVEGLHSSGPARQHAWDFLLGQMHRASLPLTLVSEEVLWHVFEREPAQRRDTLHWLSHYLAAAGVTVKILVTLRRQDQWVASWHNQLVKTDVSDVSQLSQADFVEFYRRMGLLDYEQALADWRSAFGDAALQVSAYQPAQDPVHQLLVQRLGLSIQLGPDTVALRQPSLSQAALTLGQQFNRCPGAERFKPAMIRMLYTVNPLLQVAAQALPAELANALHAQYQPGNTRLAAALGVPGQTLFADWQPRPSSSDAAPDPQALLQDMGALMAQMFIRHEDRLMRLTQRLDELEARGAPHSDLVVVHRGDEAL